MRGDEVGGETEAIPSQPRWGSTAPTSIGFALKLTTPQTPQPSASHKPLSGTYSVCCNPKLFATPLNTKLRRSAFNCFVPHSVLLPLLIFILSNRSMQIVVIISHFTQARLPSRGPSTSTCKSVISWGSVVLIGTIVTNLGLVLLFAKITTGLFFTISG